MSNWTPHIFKSNAATKALPAETVDALIVEGMRLRNLELPVVFTLGHVAAICDVPFRYLRDVVGRRFDPYRVFNVKKRDGNYRQITVPNPMLMRVQRWIHQQILLSARISSISTAYGPGCGPVENASRHRGSRWLVKIDVRNFFESISERQVYHVFRSIGYPALLAFEFTRLCTRFSDGTDKRKYRRWRSNSESYSIDAYMAGPVGHLPQGAPTSPMLANLVCRGLDTQLERISQRYGGVISRYADDIVFSAIEFNRARARKLISEVSSAILRLGFRRNETKTHVVPPGSRRIVTGLLVDSDEPRLTKRFRDVLRMHLFHARTKGIRAHCEKRKFRSLLGFREHLRGLIAYARQVDPNFAEVCKTEFDALPWGPIGI